MRGKELLRLVWMNINQNRFKTIMTSIGIVVGAATIVMVIGIGRGGKMDVEEQFSSLNAGAIDVTYEWEDEESSSGFRPGNFFGGSMPGAGMMGDQNPFNSGNSDSGNEMSGNSFQGGGMPAGGFGTGRPDMGATSGEDRSDMQKLPEADSGETPEQSGDAEQPEGAELPEGAEQPEGAEAPESMEMPEDTELSESEETESETSVIDERMNQEEIILTSSDVSDIETFVSGIRGAMISYTTRSAVEGGELTNEQTYTIAGVKENYLELSNLSMAAGEFLTDAQEEAKQRVCVLGASAVKELFENAEEAVGSQIYIDDRAYTVVGVLETTGLVSAEISPDTAILVPYDTGNKYITGGEISPVLTVLAESVDTLDSVIASVKTVLEENYKNAEFTFSDAGSQMEAAQSSNEILTLLLSAVAVIVFIVGGIGIMNVLFVSVRERTNEIGILKALGASKQTILLLFLLESAAISFIGGWLGIMVSFLITPIVRYYGVRVELNAFAWMTALAFAVIAGTLFGIYPAWKASCMEPVEALNEE